MKDQCGSIATDGCHDAVNASANGGTASLDSQVSPEIMSSM